MIIVIYFYNYYLCLLDIGQPCYGQLTAVQKGYPLTSVTRLYRRLKYTAH